MSLQSSAGCANYTVKVRAGNVAQQTYLFGSANVARRFEGNFILIMRVDQEGESINIRALGPGAPFDICRLEPGQVFALELTELSSVWAQDPVADTRVHCAIVANSVK